MAYIDWWNRTGPITMGERFGLNEISIARNTLSPTKSYIDGGRIDMKPGGIVEPGVTHYGKKENITLEQFKKEWKKFQKLKKNMGSDSEFSKYLNENYQTKQGETFTTKNVEAVRRRHDIKATVKGGQPPPAVMARHQKITALVKKLVPELNASEKFVTQEELSLMIEKELKIPAKYNAEGFKISQLDLKSYPDVRNLDKIGDKIELTLKNMLIENKPLKNFWWEALRERTGIERSTITKYLKESPTYKVIADQGADSLKNRFNFPNYHGFLKELSFSEQLTKALEIESGMPQFTDIGDERKYGNHPKNKIMSFAKRNWNQMKGEGAVQFFDKNGKLITWEYGKKLPYKEVSFSYNGKTHNMLKLSNIDYLKKNFLEVYEKQTAINKLAVKEIDNPFKKGTKISVKDLIKKIQVDNYRWKPRSGTLEILHGKLGVAGEPFTNLGYNTKDINQTEVGLKRSLDTGSITKADYNKSLKTLQSTFKASKDLDQTIIERISKLAENIKKSGPVKTKLEGLQRYQQEVKNLLQKIKTVKGPSRAKLVQTLFYIVGTGAGVKFLNDYGITPAKADTDKPIIEPGDKTQEASALALPSKWELFGGATATTIGTDVALKGA